MKRRSVAKVKPRTKVKRKKGANTKMKKPSQVPTKLDRTFESRDELAAAWNEAGREYFSEYSARLSRYYGTGDQNVDLDMNDPRPESMGDQVMRAVIELQAARKRPRDIFDPAYVPLFSWIKKSERSLNFVTILGRDEVLVRRGSAWQDDATTFHLRGDEATPLTDIRGVHRSRNRDYLVLARNAGLEIRDARAGIAGLSGPPIAMLPWPDRDIFRPRGLAYAAAWEPIEDPLAIEQLGVSDDGMRIVVNCYGQGILLASRHRGERPWTLLWPDARAPYQSGDDDYVPDAGDMTHVAISRDGTRLAFGCQDTGHFLAEIDRAGEPQWYATVGNLSEYPHYACFSDDGRYVALNSCHFYNGATISFAWDGNRGVNLDAYEEHPQAPCIDDGLRVYAACAVDRAVTKAVGHNIADSGGGFLLAGAGLLKLCDPTGAIGFAQGFGSSAGSIDFCPETRQLALSSYSGFVHLYDPYQDELPGRIDGYRPRRELARWLMWEHLPAGPLRW